MKKNRDFPLSSKDKNGTLLVGAAVKASTRDVMDTARVMDLYEAGCNIIVLDAQNGDCDVQVEYIKWIKRNCPGMDVVAGNVVRTSQAKPLLEAGADALRIGMGVGSVATTQLVKAVGRAQLSSIFTVSRFAAKYGVPVIADGGIKNTGCIIKALSIGASCVMMGSLLAGVKESPGEYFFQNGIRLKKYRGNYSAKFTTEGPSEIQMSPKMRGKGFGSPKKANTKSYPSNTVARVASGVDGAVPDNGPLRRYIPYLCQSIRHGFQDQGARSMTQVHDFLRSGELRFELRSPSAQKEGGVHDLHSFSQRLYA